MNNILINPHMQAFYKQTCGKSVFNKTYFVLLVLKLKRINLSAIIKVKDKKITYA